MPELKGDAKHPAEQSRALLGSQTFHTMPEAPICPQYQQPCIMCCEEAMCSRLQDKHARLAYQVCQEFDDTDEVCPSGIYSVYSGAESACMAAGSLAGEASMPASSSGPYADAEDLYYDPAGGNESFLSTHSLGHSSTMSVDSFASAQSADRVSLLPGALCHQACSQPCLGCLM